LGKVLVQADIPENLPLGARQDAQRKRKITQELLAERFSSKWSRLTAVILSGIKRGNPEMLVKGSQLRQQEWYRRAQRFVSYRRRSAFSFLPGKPSAV
jgi:hypothetical protein